MVDACGVFDPENEKGNFEQNCQNIGIAKSLMGGNRFNRFQSTPPFPPVLKSIKSIKFIKSIKSIP